MSSEDMAKVTNPNVQSGDRQEKRRDPGVSSFSGLRDQHLQNYLLASF
jgi:hypothetical protein